ncbi:hypothetical protein [Brevibacillus sp. NL20B1]|uniref:hypothetical protein n=1 Tax=Brevibacillus sp. NL20B1 TaxID=2829799 RepID=UPI001B99728B|nr:hypothetical protein [Brevibacillus sp. NL20B1]MBR8661134.1 hypothetical protein [Brevibacillus sp. NL20B1]
MAGKPSKWSRERVIEAILERLHNGKGITCSEIKREDGPLRGAIEKYFGNHSNALLACGIDPQSVQPLTYWTKEKIQESFLAALKDDRVTSIQSLSKYYRSLDHAIRKHYGTYENLCADIGIDVSVIKRQVREWSGEDLLRVLREMRDKGMPLNITNVLTVFPSAPQVAARCFGSYENALRAIGEDIRDHVCELKYDSFMGKKFERVVARMFADLGRGYLYQKRLANGTIMPDFYDEATNTFIEIKLSSWTVFTSGTIEKYTPYCEHLVVVYLRGDDIGHDVAKMEMRHISSYYEELRSNGLSHYIDEFTELLNELRQRESEVAA